MFSSRSRRATINPTNNSLNYENDINTFFKDLVENIIPKRVEEVKQIREKYFRLYNNAQKEIRRSDPGLLYFQVNEEAFERPNVQTAYVELKETLKEDLLINKEFFKNANEGAIGFAKLGKNSLYENEKKIIKHVTTKLNKQIPE